ncbi:hypothetical protein TYRP_020863, partial [Tyrophagus putrescentiae]
EQPKAIYSITGLQLFLNFHHQLNRQFLPTVYSVNDWHQTDIECIVFCTGYLCCLDTVYPAYLGSSTSLVTSCV